MSFSSELLFYKLVFLGCRQKFECEKEPTSFLHLNFPFTAALNIHTEQSSCVKGKIEYLRRCTSC